jgi:hypothetical protein
MHIFKVHNEIHWANNFKLKAKNITMFHHNFMLKKMVFIQYLKAKQERFDDMEVI